MQDETDEFIPDDDVLEEGPTGSDVGFAGPSDAPPSQVSRVHDTPEVPGRPLRIRWIAAVAAGVFLGATARMLVPSSPAAPSVASPSAQPAELVLAPVVVAMPPAVATPAGDLPVTAPPSAAAPDAPPPDGTEAKHAAQHALDHGKAALAIELGQRSVELDPTDADAWLVLGAAYLQRGAFKDARRCFSSCAQEATHGAKRECAALLR